MPRESASLLVDADARFAKKVRDAALLRDVPARRSVEMAFELVRFARELNEAADLASS